MNPILTIAKRDFKSGFATPKSGAVLFFFLLFMGLFFSSFVKTFIEFQARAGMMGGGGAPTMEQLIKAMFYNLHFILILIVPAVTMGTFAEEQKAQTLRLLQTAPIKAVQIVLGKFAAAAGLMAFVLLLSASYPLFLKAYGTPDMGIVMSSYVGLFLLICAQISLGIWISSLTKNQFLAFIFTMFGLFMMLVLDFISKAITTTGGQAEALIQYFGTTKHLDVFFKGLITVGDSMFFILFTAVFLFFTTVTLDSRRWK